MTKTIFINMPSYKDPEIWLTIEDFIKKVPDIKNISVDKGNEFVNNNFKKLMNDNSINLLIFDKSISPNAMSIIERFNLTIRNKIDNYMKTYNTKKFIDILPDLLENYNNSVHSSIKIEPSKVNKEIEEKLYTDKHYKKDVVQNNIE